MSLKFWENSRWSWSNLPEPIIVRVVYILQIIYSSILCNLSTTTCICILCSEKVFTHIIPFLQSTKAKTFRSGVSYLAYPTIEFPLVTLIDSLCSYSLQSSDRINYRGLVLFTICLAHRGACDVRSNQPKTLDVETIRKIASYREPYSALV